MDLVPRPIPSGIVSSASIVNGLMSIVIPVYNEAGKIGNDIQSVCGYFKKDFELIVINDGSTDKTEQILNSYMKKISQLKVIHYAPNRGKGFAVKTGVLTARGEWILFADAGGCVPFSDVEQGLKLIRAGADVAIGSRHLRDSMIKKPQRLYRQWGGTLFRKIVRTLFSIGDIQDTQCGFKLFKHQAARSLFSTQKIEKFMFDLEWIQKAVYSGMDLKEFPVHWNSDGDSRFNPTSGALRTLLDLARIKAQL